LDELANRPLGTWTDLEAPVEGVTREMGQAMVAQVLALKQTTRLSTAALAARAAKRRWPKTA
jgi:hypothetical protein